MLYIDNTYVYIHRYVYNTYVKLCAFILKQGFHHLTRVPICLTSQLFYYWERLFLKIHFHTKTSELWCFLPDRVASLMLFERLRPQLGVGRPTRRTCSSSSSSGWGRRRRRRGRRKSGAGQWTLIFSSWSISATSAATRRRTVFWQRRRVPGQSPSTPPLTPSTLLSMKQGGGRGRGKGKWQKDLFIYNQLACRFTLSSADDSPEYENLSGGSSSHMQTLDVRIKLTPSVVRETYGNFERREEEEVVVEGGDGRGVEKQIYDRIRVGKDWGRNMVNSDWRDSSESSFSSNSCSRASDGSAERNFFKLKMPLKCLNKVTNFFLFK